MQNTTQEARSSNTLWWNEPILYWQPNQVAITFRTPVNREEAIKSLNLDILGRFLAMHGFQLTSYTPDDVPLQKGPPRNDRERLEGEPGKPDLDLNSPEGKYLFTPSSGQGTLAMCFFHCANAPITPASSSLSQGMTSPTTPDSTYAIVSLLNQNLDKLRNNGNIPIVAAAPNWMSGGTPITKNCPADPPIPLTGTNAKFSNWKFRLPELSPTMQDLTGKGVTVFVLDTIPTAEHIRKAAKLAGGKNVLLKRIKAAMDSASPSFVVQYNRMPARLAPNIQAGKDLDGEIYGFKMRDHGLFVAGIIRDLVPEAKIECVRVLNDSGVGDTAVLCHALHEIQDRMAQENLEQVIINLSLEYSPSDANLPGIWFGKGNCCCYTSQDLASVIGEIGHLRLGIHQIIQSLTSRGAVIVAASGNESNANSHPPQRYGPRYPAAFPEVISVGAVDKNGQAASYSDYPAVPPQHNGIATYGGSIPLPVPPALSQASEPKAPGAKTWASVDDAVVGVYTSSHYPMLLAGDVPPDPDGYPAPSSSHCWAYWSGTSFATPIISALAARVLEAQNTGVQPKSVTVQDMLTTAPGQQLLTGSIALPNSSAFGVEVGVLHAEQVSS